jgi:hypothetical protein
VTRSVLVASYSALSDVVGRLDDEAAWTATGCTGWAVRDLVHHLHADAVRALVAVHSPAQAPADCDRVRYWADWGSDPEADERTRRWTRLEAGLFSWPGLRDRYVEAAAAVVHALASADPADVVTTQGHALTVDDLASTLAVEATLHHLDLVVSLDAPGPPTEGLAEARRVVAALLGSQASVAGWTDLRVALVGTGRATVTAAELGDLAGATVPVFT